MTIIVVAATFTSPGSATSRLRENTMSKAKSNSGTGFGRQPRVTAIRSAATDAAKMAEVNHFSCFGNGGDLAITTHTSADGCGQERGGKAAVRALAPESACTTGEDQCDQPARDHAYT